MSATLDFSANMAWEKFEMKRLLGTTFLLIFATAAVAADYSSAIKPPRYRIGGLFYAVFPGTPTFTGELGSGKEKSRGYAYTDEQNFIFYTATYQVSQNHYRKSQVRDGLRDFANGQEAIGKVTSFRFRKIQANECATFSLDVPYQGETIRKFTVVCYKDGRFLSWSVQEIVDFSTLSAKALFNKYLPYFSVS